MYFCSDARVCTWDVGCLCGRVGAHWGAALACHPALEVRPRGTQGPTTQAACVRLLLPQVSLVVNVASACGFTDGHYRGLQQLQRDLGPRHFTVLAFPCNQFGQQEPDGDREIESFARRTYGVSFPMFSKVAVTGTGAHPAFKYLTHEKQQYSKQRIPYRGRFEFCSVSQS
nr:glutathione peroxidase 7 isoform X4 [Vulpes vulpes]